MVAPRQFTPLLPRTTWSESGASLSDDTKPSAIEACHRAAVAEHLRDHPGATVEEVSVALVLPTFNVVRAMAWLNNRRAA